MRRSGSSWPESARRTVVGGAAAALCLPAILHPARAADTVWRIGHTAPEFFPLHKRLVEAAAEVAERTAGRMEITVQGDGQLGSGVGQLAQLRAGGLEMAPLPGQILASVQAVAAVPMIGFAWRGPETLWPAMDGALGRLIRDALRDRAGLVPLDTTWDFGFRVITTSGRSVRSAADLVGLRLRTPVEPEYVALFQALRANPVAMPLGEVFRALASGQLDGQESLLGLVQAIGFQAVQDRCAVTNHIWDGHHLCINPAAWRRIPDAFKDIVATAFNAAGRRQRADHAEQEAATREVLARAGMTFSAVDPASFRTALGEAGYYRELRRKFGDRVWDVLEPFTGRLG